MSISDDPTANWLRNVPALARTPSTASLGEITEDRVAELHRRYCSALMDLPGVVTCGIGREPPMRDAGDRGGERYVLRIGVLRGHAPSGPLFIEEVPVVVRVVGQPHRVLRDAPKVSDSP
jgi:hypothetical protein